MSDPGCELVPILLHKPNLPPQTIFYCPDCQEAWSLRLLKKAIATCPSPTHPKP